MVVRRRQPAGTGLGGARGVRRRRRPRLRLPQPRLRQAARQLHLVDQPPGRRRHEPLRRRVPRPRQHRADRPLAPPGRLHARAVGQHRLDGLLRAEHGRDRGAPPPQRPSDDRPGREVPRAIRAHLGGTAHAGAVGRGGRLLLRQAETPGRLHAGGEGALDGRHPAAACGGGRAGGRGGARLRDQQAQRRDCSTAGAPRSHASRRRACSRATSAAGECSSASSASSGCCGCSSGCSTRTRFSRPTGSAPSRASTPSTPSRSRSTAALEHRLRAGRVDHRHVRRQLELARPDLDARQLPGRQRARPVRPLSRRRRHDRVPDGLRRAHDDGRDRRRPSRPA